MLCLPIYFGRKRCGEGKGAVQPFTAVFDSGFGGLTVLRACARRCPHERFGYFGDHAHAPYGNRPPEEIARLASDAFAYLARYPLRAAVVACNTVTALCIDELRARFPFPVIGVEPAVRPAVAFAQGGAVLLLATRATLASRRVRELLGRTGGRVETFCPARLAGEIERNIGCLARADVEGCLCGVPRKKYAAAVLGCTHYVFVGERIAAALGCPVFDGNAGTADHLAAILNICSENAENRRAEAPFFIGSAKNIEKSVYFSLP